MRSLVRFVLAVAVAWAALGPAPLGAQDYGGLPEGPDRDAVYFSCSACHSIDLVTRQRLSRERWDALMDWMVEEQGMYPLSGWARTLVVNYLAGHFGEDEEDWDGLPPGPGREEVYYLCQPCHSLALVKQQGLSRQMWDTSLDWMVEEQGMPEPDPEERRLLLDYLSTWYGPDRAAAGSQQ
jgi:cytochrome c